MAEEQSISKEALHRAIFYLDQLAATIGISKEEYQLYGLTCLFISHKVDTRKVLSYNIASVLVEGSIEQWKFEEYEENILRQLTFKLHPFTLWV